MPTGFAVSVGETTYPMHLHERLLLNLGLWLCELVTERDKAKGIPRAL